MARRALVLSAATAGALVLAVPLGARGAQDTVFSIRSAVEGELIVGKGTASGKFTLEFGSSTDTGKVTWKYVFGNATRSPEGQQYWTANRTETFKGRLGTFVIRATGRQYPIGVRHRRDPDGDSTLWIGTWKFVSGTGRYAKLKGGGPGAGFAEVADDPFSPFTFVYMHRYEGYVQKP